jgi:3-oxoacyl-[acyl-carrier-protein] synthase III
MIQPRRIMILGTGSSLPGERLTSAELDGRLGLSPGTVEGRTGVRHRFVERRSAAALGAEAARAALDAAGMTLAEVDCLVAANGTPDQALPSNAALLSEALGLGPVPAFDVGASCLSFLAALDTLSWPIAAGRYRRALVVSADLASCGLDWSALGASGIFGDGAAAAVLGPSGDAPATLLATAFETHSQGAHLCEIPAGGSRHHPSRTSEDYQRLALFRMNGKALFRFTVERLEPFLSRLLAEAQVTLDDLALVVPHQASRHALDYLRRSLRLPEDRIVDLFAERGNQVAASLPSALDAAVRSGRLHRGDRALLMGTGAGVSLGGAVLCF